MIVCVCANVSDKVIAELVWEGLTLEEIMRRTRAGTGCRKCIETLKILIRENEDNESDYRGW